MKNIYFLGPKGSYSDIIVQKTKIGNNYIVCNNFIEIIKNTCKEKEGIGVLPIENSTTSSVHENMDYLFNENLTIIGEAFLTIHLYLIGFANTKREEIKEVYSHHKALAQCKEYIRKHNFIPKETSSTASAKNLILSLKNKSLSAIGSKELVNKKELTIIDSDIGDNKYNRTRFVFITTNKNNFLPGIKNKASIMFTLQHKPGALAKILTELAQSQYNITKIESRPIPETDWEYQFWIDIEENEEINKQGLSYILKHNTNTYKIIGIYPSGKNYE